MKVTNICSNLLAATAVLLLIAVPAYAQDEDEGPLKWGEDAKYVETVVVKFKPGKRERAMEIISEYYAPASDKAGTTRPMLVIHMQTGHWDMALVWELAGGTADLEWFRSPDNIKWRAALAEIAGGEEEAAAILDEYSASVADILSNVGHYHTGEE